MGLNDNKTIKTKWVINTDCYPVGDNVVLSNLNTRK